MWDISQEGGNLMFHRIASGVFSLFCVVVTALCIPGFSYSGKVMVDDVPYVVQRGHLD